MKLSSAFNKSYTDTRTSKYSYFSSLSDIASNLAQSQNATDYLDYRMQNMPMEGYLEYAGRVTDSFNRIPGQIRDLGQTMMENERRIGGAVQNGARTLLDGATQIGTGIQERMDGVGRALGNIAGNIEQSQSPKIPVPSRLGTPVPQELQAPGNNIPIPFRKYLTARDLTNSIAGGAGAGAGIVSGGKLYGSLAKQRANIQQNSM